MGPLIVVRYFCSASLGNRCQSCNAVPAEGRELLVVVAGNVPCPYAIALRMYA